MLEHYNKRLPVHPTQCVGPFLSLNKKAEFDSAVLMETFYYLSANSNFKASKDRKRNFSVTIDNQQISHAEIFGNPKFENIESNLADFPSAFFIAIVTPSMFSSTFQKFSSNFTSYIGKVACALSASAVKPVKVLVM